MTQPPLKDIMIPAWIDGVLTPVEKLSVHQRGLRHKAISVFLLCDGEIMLQKRALGKYHTPGLWANAVCTHPLWDEQSMDTAKRRITEELGIKNVDLTFRRTLEYRADVGEGLVEHEVVDLFTGTVARDVTIDLNAEEVSDIRWIGLQDLTAEIAASPDIFTPWLKIYMADYSESIIDLT